MNGSRLRALLLWSVCIVIAAIVVVRARYITDLSAFLPDKPTPTQQLLVDQLRDGPASRVILIAIEGADAGTRAKLSRPWRRRCAAMRVSPGSRTASRSPSKPTANSCSCIATC